jgi:CheY-like chemotaxis protein
MKRAVPLVEDSPGDFRATQEAFHDAGASIDLHVAIDGVEAMSFLRKENHNANAARPDHILQDLNLPKMSGREVLARLKDDANLRKIPTIILATSVEQTDILASYQLQANCYLYKPVQLEEFEILVNGLNDFWLMKAKLPRQGAE